MQTSVPLNKKGIVLASKLQDKIKAKATLPLSLFHLVQSPTSSFKGSGEISDETIPHGESFQKFVYEEHRKSELSSQQERLRKGFRWIMDAEKALLMVLRMYIMYRRGRKNPIRRVYHITPSSESSSKSAFLIKAFQLLMGTSESTYSNLEHLGRDMHLQTVILLCCKLLAVYQTD